MAEWHHQLNCNEFEQALGDGGEPGSWVYRSPWSWKELDTTEHLNNTYVIHAELSIEVKVNKK